MSDPLKLTWVLQPEAIYCTYIHYQHGIIAFTVYPSRCAEISSTEAKINFLFNKLIQY